MKAMSLAVMILGSFVTAASAGDARFTTAPSATLAGEKIKIAFAVSEPIDVEVSIDDGKGKVLRHLAAGLLGDNSPAPFRKGLDQELTWDGNDDAGKPILADKDRSKGIRIRVSLGRVAKLHRIYGWSGQWLASLAGMQFGPDGKLYIVQEGDWVGHRASWLVTAHDNLGRYHHQVYPGPAGMPPEKRKGWSWTKLADGTELPVVHHLMSRALYPGAVMMCRNFPVLTRDGRMLILSGNGEGQRGEDPDIRDGRRLLTLNVDGSVPETFLGPVLFPTSYSGFAYLALTPDEKFVYVSGLFDAKKGPCHVVWKVRLDGTEKPQVFLGRMFEPGAGKDRLREPMGLDVDRDGNVFIADYGNNRIAVLDANGTFLDEVSIKTPDQVKVTKSGVLYVLQVRERTKKIGDPQYYQLSHSWVVKGVTKLDGFRSKKVLAELPDPGSKLGGGAYMAVDDSGKTPVLFIGGLGFSNSTVYRCQESGGRLTLGELIAGFDQFKRKPAGDVGFTGDIAWANGKLFSSGPSSWGFKGSTWTTYDAETGKYAGDLKIRGSSALMHGELISGKDERLYFQAMGVRSEIERFTARGEPASFTSIGSNVLKELHHGHSRQTGIFVDKQGTLFVPHGKDNREIDPVWVTSFRSDGSVLKDKHLEIHGARTAGLVVDPLGNIYMGAQVAPKQTILPEWIAGRLPKDVSVNATRAYSQCGTLFSFPPSGGAIVPDPKGEFVGYLKHIPARLSLRDVNWHQRVGLVPGKGIGCYCETTRIDIDEFGRVYVPDTLRFSVAVFDRAGNLVMRIGTYGNMDSRGPDSPVPMPEIAFGWPLSARYGNGKLFVSDLTNCRLVGVRFQPGVSAECEIK